MYINEYFPDANAKVCQKYKKENSKPIFLMDIKKKKSLKILEYESNNM